jgi:hypothetical protein
MSRCCCCISRTFALFALIVSFSNIYSSSTTTQLTHHPQTTSHLSIHLFMAGLSALLKTCLDKDDLCTILNSNDSVRSISKNSFRSKFRVSLLRYTSRITTIPNSWCVCVLGKFSCRLFRSLVPIVVTHRVICPRLYTSGYLTSCGGGGRRGNNQVPTAQA